MSHVYTEENPKVSVGDANDVPTTIPTPDQLGSLLVTYSRVGPTTQIAAIYAALVVGLVPQWVLISSPSMVGPEGIKFFSGLLEGNSQIATGFMADVGDLPMSSTGNEYPAGPIGFLASTLTVHVPKGQNTMSKDVTVVLQQNKADTPITLVITAGLDGTFTSALVAPVVFVPGDTYDISVSENGSPVETSIRLSAQLS